MIGHFFAKKAIELIQAEVAASELKRPLGKWNLVALGVGCIIGAGIFVMTGTAAANHAGPAVMVSFIFTGIACALVGFCYAELASTLPVSGSAYSYAYATLGEAPAWGVGWLMLLEYGVAAATVAAGWSGYVNSFLLSLHVVIPPEFTMPYGEAIKVGESYRDLFVAKGYGFNQAGQLLAASGETVRAMFNLPAAIASCAVAALLISGVSKAAKANDAIVFVKVAVVVLFVAIGAFYVNTDNWKPFIPANEAPGVYGWDGVFRASSIIFFAYIGFEAVSTAAQEARNPQKDMPFGILGSLFVCTALYIAVSAVMTGVVPFRQLAVADPMAVAVDSIGLGWFAFVIKIGAIFGLSSVMMALMYGQTRIFYVMSHDGLIPPAFCKIHPKFCTPYVNTAFVGAAVALISGLTPIGVLGDLVSLGTLVAFIVACFSVMYMRRTHPELHRPFRAPFVPVLPLLGMAACGYLIFSIFFGRDAAGSYVLTESGHRVVHFTGMYLAAGVVVYAAYGMRKSVLRRSIFSASSIK
ncbi:MAG: amino acid permease [Rickettsiales bacterium]